MNRLYQLLREVATLFRADVHEETSHAVRTEVTVHRQHRTVLLGRPGSGFDGICPLCGQAMPPSGRSDTDKHGSEDDAGNDSRRLK